MSGCVGNVIRWCVHDSMHPTNQPSFILYPCDSPVSGGLFFPPFPTEGAGWCGGQGGREGGREEGRDRENDEGTRQTGLVKWHHQAV